MDLDCSTVPFYDVTMEVPSVPGIDLAQVSCTTIGQRLPRSSRVKD